MIAVARTADVVVMMLDATKGDVQRSVHQGRGTHRASDSPLCLWLKSSVSNVAPSGLDVLSSAVQLGLGILGSGTRDTIQPWLSPTPAVRRAHQPASNNRALGAPHPPPGTHESTV